MSAPGAAGPVPRCGLLGLCHSFWSCVRFLRASPREPPVAAKATLGGGMPPGEGRHTWAYLQGQIERDKCHTGSLGEVLLIPGQQGMSRKKGGESSPGGLLGSVPASTQPGSPDGGSSTPWTFPLWLEGGVLELEVVSGGLGVEGLC